MSVSSFCSGVGRRGGRIESKGEEEAAALQVGVGGFQLASSSSTQEPQRREATSGDQTLPRRHPDHRQFPRRHDEQQAQPPQQPSPPPPPRPAGVFHQRHHSQTGAGDDAARPDGDAWKHRRFPTTEIGPRVSVGAEREAEGAQLSGVLPPGGGRGELQPGLALGQDPHRR